MITKETLKGKAFVNSKEIEWEELGGGVTRKILGYDDEVMMVVVRFEKGAVGSLHHHVHRQVTYVAAGKFEVTIDGNKEVLQQGDSFFVAPDRVHGVVALEEGSLIDVFTPARQDFL
jgi:quercetin dioxygenase-like cupin family protein